VRPDFVVMLVVNPSGLVSVMAVVGIALPCFVQHEEKGALIWQIDPAAPIGAKRGHDSTVGGGAVLTHNGVTMTREQPSPQSPAAPDNRYDDLLFVASDVTGKGYFKNFGRTLRQGTEVHLSERLSRVTFGGKYTFLRATYESRESVDGSSNSSNDSASAGAPGMDGVIQIQPGDGIPLIPQHIFKAFADAQVTRKISADLDFIAVSSSFARGNENNHSGPDGIYYLGPGTCPGYGVVNFGARYQIHKRVQIFAQINNLLDHHYYTAAQLGPTGFTNQGTFIARPFSPVDGNYPIVHATFYSPGAPFGIWGGMRFKF
jgi:outer membrane receptor protein involved in Fe transport